MIYNNRHYPHPVLGIEDDIQGDVQVKLKVSSNSEFILLENIFSIDNPDLHELIKANQACYSTHITCPGTFFRNNYIAYKELPSPIKIKASDLNGEVELDYLICATTDIKEYQNKASNADFGDTKFEINKGDILAYLGKGKFYANKTYQETISVSSLMNINTDKKPNHPFYLDYNAEKITIFLSQEDYELYQEVKLKKFGSILHSSIVLPALQQVITFLDRSESEDYQSMPWYKIMQELMDKYGGNDSLETAQKILELPLRRAFQSLKDIQNTI
ncbi:MAG: hypothetical protein ABJ004_03945 [Cyclobacteriaceae bacterium]